MYLKQFSSKMKKKNTGTQPYCEIIKSQDLFYDTCIVFLLLPSVLLVSQTVTLVKLSLSRGTGDADFTVDSCQNAGAINRKYF